MAPSDRSADGDRLKDTQAYVLIKAGLDGLLPVDGDWDGGVVGDRAGVGVDHEAYGGPRHLWEWLVLANVERARAVVVQ